MVALLEREIVAALPEAVTAVFQRFFTCEFTTIGKHNTPMTWPVMPLYWPQRHRFVLFTSIGLPQKAFNVRRDPRVSLLFSDPTGCGLADPPRVLVQGVATVSDQIVTSQHEMDPELFDLFKRQAVQMVARQPSMKLYLSNPMARYLMDWYFMRLIITVVPQRISWWRAGDEQGAPGIWEVSDVA